MPVAEGRPITWFSPDPRFVLKAEDFRIPKSLKKMLKKGLFDYRVNTSFAEVIHECSIVPRPGQDGTWITDDPARYCTVRLIEVRLLDGGELTKSENRFFGGQRDFQRNILKRIKRKEI